jgi:transposase InsO family protein
MCYSLVSEKYVRAHNLVRTPIGRTEAKGIGKGTVAVDSFVSFDMDIDGHKEHVFAYVLEDIMGYDVILGRPWMDLQDVVMETRRKRLFIRSSGVRVRASSAYRKARMDIRQIGAAAFSMYGRAHKKKDTGRVIEMFSASMADIEKALRPKVKTDPLTKLPVWLKDLVDAWLPSPEGELAPHRPGVDHKIELIKDADGKKPEVPWGPLYNMSREELLVLRKTLTELLDKNFIRVSGSSASAPILFVKKPGGGLRFCVDYRALNVITKKDRYPLPLIHETLQRIGKARWFTKMDVSAAFHRIRIAKGHEWMTAFRTRFGLYEWLVTPFGLANAPSTFQRYINWVLREWLDDFVTAYMDDVLVYSSGSKKEHRSHVRQVVQKLHAAGLQLDIDKCDFEVTSTKYLGFIVDANKGICMDPEKVKAITDWVTPSSVRGVRGFLGFANFYRQFIENFSDIVRPLVDLTKKNTSFIWNVDADKAFHQLKASFVSAPVLVQFDPDRETVLETDASGWCTGGILSQRGDDGELRPCAFFSKKNAPAECNYDIHDKELLAIVNCVREWEDWLSAIGSFDILTDHRNLAYFLTRRRYNERHMRWYETLAAFTFTIKYRSGQQNNGADALSRREQDLPANVDDSRIAARQIQILQEDGKGNLKISPKDQIGVAAQELVSECPPTDADTARFFETHLNQLWTEAPLADPTWPDIINAITTKAPRFPPALNLKISMSEVTTDASGHPQFRGRRWVPAYEPLRTKLIEAAHVPLLNGHPGKHTTYDTLARDFFWPGMNADVKRYIRNCDTCRRIKPWRDGKHGLLKPLPIPLRPWTNISCDFIGMLPNSDGYVWAMVVTDRLSKTIIIEPLSNIEALTVAHALIRRVYSQHGLPASMISDRGPQFVKEVGREMARLLQIEQRLSTAYHPETDGGNERANTEIEVFFRAYAAKFQTTWAQLCPAAEFAINTRPSSSTGVSPFFVTHGYEPNKLLQQPGATASTSPTLNERQAQQIVSKLREVSEWAQAHMAEAQQRQETYANKGRRPAPAYKEGDLVWLNLKNAKVVGEMKKLDWKHAKFRIVKVVGTHAVRLAVPPGIEPTFHVSLVRPAADDPFPSQRQEDWQPEGIITDEGEEWEIECIVGEFQQKRGRGHRQMYLVKWVGYEEPTAEPRANLEDTTALDQWEDLKNQSKIVAQSANADEDDSPTNSPLTTTDHADTPIGTSNSIFDCHSQEQDAQDKDHLANISKDSELKKKKKKGKKQVRWALPLELPSTS